MKMKSPFYDDRRLIGARIADLRTKKGLSQTDLALAADMLRPHISRAEKGKYNTTLDTLLKIAAALNCDIKFIPKK
jgi:transcriptional regulator with XRE-family HTH domain